MPLFLALSACVLTHHDTTPLAAPAPAHDTLAAVLAHPVDLEIDRIVSATWEVDRSGLLDLDHPGAAGLSDDSVAIDLPIVRVRHPTRGAVFVDTGIDRHTATSGETPGRGLVRGFLKGIEPQVPLGALIDAEPHTAAVLLTHIPLDHVLGLPDVPRDVPVIGGPGDTAMRDWRHPLMRGTYRELLADRGPLQELDPTRGVSLGGIDGAVDLFGDGAIWALPAPGHTPGTTAYFLNTPDPVLVLGDVSHTCWGWENDVPPGTFSHDRDAAAVSFAAIRNWASQIPALTVIAGHTACDEAALVAVGG